MRQEHIGGSPQRAENRVGTIDSSAPGQHSAAKRFAATDSPVAAAETSEAGAPVSGVSSASPATRSLVFGQVDVDESLV